MSCSGSDWSNEVREVAKDGLYWVDRGHVDAFLATMGFSHNGSRLEFVCGNEMSVLVAVK